MAGLQTLTRTTPIPCGRCGRTLIDQESIARGIGPECLEVERSIAAWPFETPVLWRDHDGVWKHGHVVAYQPQKPTAPLRVWCGTDARNFPLDAVKRIEVQA